jgi:ethanolamine ammonia-lyase small subunit
MSGPMVPWAALRRFTTARVALGRAGNGLPTAAHLDFQQAHAQARDAVWSALDMPALLAALAGVVPAWPPVVVRSAVADRRTYLMRPDLGRRLAEGEAAKLPRAPGSVAFLLADGLCALGVQVHAPAVLARIAAGLPAIGLEAGPVVVAGQGRVALGDVVGEAIGAAAVVVLIGERPGLSAMDSMGLYLTWAPRQGRSDAERNCISNIRPAGLSYDAAAGKALWLLRAARAMGATGVALKDEQEGQGVLPGAASAAVQG